jgi:hypothetical protein
MEEILEDDGAVLGEELLVARDVAIARLPDLFRREIVYADDEDVFVVRAVVDGELA